MTSEKIKLSSLVIAKNESANIARCLESQLGFIDDLLVLIDDTSTDNTEEIISGYYNVRCEKIKWKGYSATKIEGLEKTKYEWVLWLDADERISPELKQELLSFKSSAPPYAAYSIPRKAIFLGKWIKHSGWYPGRVIRLFNKNKAKFSQNYVHEHLVVNGSVGELTKDIEHYTDPSIKHYFKKFNHYTSLAAEELKIKNKKFSVWSLIIRPAAVFFKMYFIRRGFMDGIQGFILAVFSSAYVFTKYAKLWELTKRGKKNGKELT
jgi:glycosyltransferase involved in cell wall biosynthesis